MRVPRRLAWVKSTERKVKVYTEILKNKLEGLEDPACLDCTNTMCKAHGHSEERDFYLLAIMSHCI